MKKLLLASTLTVLLSTGAFSQAQAQQTTADENAQTPDKPLIKKEQRNELIGLGSGAVTGSIIGGPVGGIIGALFGIFIANDVNNDSEIDMQAGEILTLQSDLKQKENALYALQNDFEELEKTQMLQMANFDDKAATEWLRALPTLESSIQFKTASFLVEDAFTQQLDSLAALLRKYPELHVSLTGFADVRGDSAYNKTLSQKRAQAVKEYLLSQNVKNSQFSMFAQGEIQRDELVGQSAVNPEALFFDRRVTLQVGPNQKSLQAASELGSSHTSSGKNEAR
uniref:sortase-associated OmpA-like protein PdsO n=1 Tax=Ningiella ruwaisensis TaxID=2364274 RepID=UPI001445C9A9|nr:sortase-associated OmpA-like protein PdsO [Ningiella ruwaisensis]